MPIFGTDVSTYNKRINYTAAKIAGVRFAMVKATQGHSLYADHYLFADSMLDTHINGFYKAGIPVGAYHFFTASTVSETYAEADFFLKTLEPYRDKLSLYLACDAENYKNKYLEGLSRSQLSELISLFCRRVEEAGYNACHYTNTDHIRNYIDLTKIPYPVWQAHYISGGTTKKPADAGDKLAIHQYTSAGQLTGVVGSYDLNFGYAPLARLIISARTSIEKKTLDYLEAYETGDSILTKLADKLVAKELKPIKTPTHEKLVPLIRYHCSLTEGEAAHMNAYKWNSELFSKLYAAMTA